MAEGEEATAAAEQAFAQGEAAFRKGDFAQAVAKWQVSLQHYGTQDNEPERSRVLTDWPRLITRSGSIARHWDASTPRAN